MKKILPIALIIMLIVTMTGCAINKTQQNFDQEIDSNVTMIGNPWKDYDSIEDAEAAVGFELNINPKIANYEISSIRTMNNIMLEVVYSNGNNQVIVRKQHQEGEDISGDYNEYDVCSEEIYKNGTIIKYFNSYNGAIKKIISNDGYSWSIIAPNGYLDQSENQFIDEIFGV